MGQMQHDAIGDGLRIIWRIVVASPLPQRISSLLEELRSRELEREREAAARQRARGHHSSREG
jgi:hypothetical protein